MSAGTIQIDKDLKQALKNIGRHMNPNISLTYPQIIEGLIVEYCEGYELNRNDF